MCGAVTGDDMCHKHEIKNWQPQFNDFEGALEGYETVPIQRTVPYVFELDSDIVKE